MIKPDGGGARTAHARRVPVLQGAFQTLCRACTPKSPLRPSGRLYIAVPVHALLWSDEDAIAGHDHPYNVKQLRAKLEGAGFAVGHKTYFSVS